MQVKKSLLVAGAAATVGLTGLTGLGVASAASSTQAGDTGATTIIDKLVKKFNLNKDEVTEVFDEARTEREAEMQQRVEDRLDAAVEDGKLTETQKDAIIAKLAELKSEREAERDEVKDMTAEERKAHMQQKMDDLKAWAEDKDIPTEYLPQLMLRGHGHGGPGMAMPEGEPATSTAED